MAPVLEDPAELERRVNAFQKEADQLRFRRDELNDQAHMAADERDDLNAQVRGFVNQANEHRKRRDEMNVQVQRAKQVRDESNRAAEVLENAFEDLKHKKLPRTGRSAGFLRHELQRLEFEHQTKVLTPPKEKAIIDEMSRLRNELRSKEKEMETDPDLKAAFEAFHQARDKAEKNHEKVGELAESAQGEHEAMVKLFEQSDQIRRKADAVQERFVAAKLEAEKFHKEFSKVMDQIRAMQTSLEALRVGADPAAAAQDAQKVTQQEADAIYERFKQGEKLSTKDLMTLQKAGLL